MLLKLGVIIFIVLASTVLALAGALLLPPELARAIPLLMPLIAFAGMAWLMLLGGTAMADECKDKAIDKNGKPLAGPALTAHVKKCRHDVCDKKAVAEKTGKRLSGAAYNSFMQKCEKDAAAS